MTFYFFMGQIPELRPLTRRQRKLVYQCAMEALFVEQPEAVWSGAPPLMGGLLGGLAVGFGLAASGLAWATHHRLLCLAAAGLAGFLVGVFISAHYFHARLRPYLQRVREERKEEIDLVH